MNIKNQKTSNVCTLAGYRLQVNRCCKDVNNRCEGEKRKGKEREWIGRKDRRPGIREK